MTTGRTGIEKPLLRLSDTTGAKEHSSRCADPPSRSRPMRPALREKALAIPRIPTLDRYAVFSADNACH